MRQNNTKQLQLSLNLLVNLLMNALASRYLEQKNQLNLLRADETTAILNALAYKEAIARGLDYNSFLELFKFTYPFYPEEVNKHKDEKQNFAFISWHIFDEIYNMKELPDSFQKIIELYEQSKIQFETQNDVEKVHKLSGVFLELFKNINKNVSISHLNQK